MSWFRWTQTALACPNCQLRSHSTTSDCNFLQIKRKKFQSNAQRRFHQRLTFRCLLAGSILRFRTRHVILLRRRRLMTTQKFSMSGKEIERIVKWKFDQKVMRSKDGNADGKHFLIWRNSETDFGTLRDESFANLLAIFENDFFILQTTAQLCSDLLPDDFCAVTWRVLLRSNEFREEIHRTIDSLQTDSFIWR